MDGMDFDAGGMMEMGDVGEMGEMAQEGGMGLVGVLGAGLWVGNLLGRAYFGGSPWNWPLGVPGGPVTGYQLGQPGRAARVVTWPDVMTTAQAAAYLQVSEAEVVALLEEGGLRGRKVGGGWRVAKSVLDAWMLGDTVV